MLGLKSGNFIWEKIWTNKVFEFFWEVFIRKDFFELILFAHSFKISHLLHISFVVSCRVVIKILLLKLLYTA